MTVRIDRTLRRAVLGDEALAVGALLACEPGHEALGRPNAQAARAALQAAGALEDGRPIGWLQDLLEVVARPDSRARVEVRTAAELVVTAVAWGVGERGVLGLLADGGTELSALDPIHLPWVIAREVGLRPYPEPALTEAVTLTLEQIASIQRLLDQDDEEGACAVVDGAGGASAVALLRDRNFSWRVTVTTTGADGEATTRSVAALDGGPHGLFLTEAVAAGDGPPAVRLNPADAESGVAALLALFEVATAEPVAAGRAS